LSELLALASPEVLRARQAFMLGSTGLLGWPAVALLAAALALVLLPALALARLLDALVLGEAAAASLGLPVTAGRLALVLALALATGAAVSQAGLIAFVGLVAPHLVRWQVDVTHRGLLAGSALVGGALLLAADLGARMLMPPQELPVGALTALGGGIYLLALLRRRGAREGRA
jgi:iron complex transport system permease protein